MLNKLIMITPDWQHSISSVLQHNSLLPQQRECQFSSEA